MSVSKPKIKHILIIYFFITSQLSSFSQGLSFAGNEKTIDERSSYIVFDKDYDFVGDFNIKFDIRVNKIYDFGYIFRIKDGQSSQIINLTYAHHDRDKECVLRLNTESERNLLDIKMRDDFVKRKQWINVSLHFDLKNNKVDVCVDNKTYEAELNNRFKNKITPWVCFGKSDHIVDVPAFSLRNLEVGNASNFYSFAFDESSGNKVHDQRKNIVGNVFNPTWLINESYYWKEIFTYTSKKVSGVSFDEPKQEILFFNEDSLLIWDLSKQTSAQHKYINKMPISTQLGTHFIDTLNNRLYVYEVNNLPVSNTTMAYLDLNTMKWASVSTDFLSQQLHHHSSYFDSEKNKYFIFGGFGNKKYSNKLYCMDLMSDKWSILNLNNDTIYPRFFSGMAHYKDNLYIFGGIGNKSGDQTIGREYFYDLYKINIKNRSVEKCFNIKNEGLNFVPTRNLVMLNDSSFFALCYPEFIPKSHLKLLKFNIKNGTYEELGDSIPMISEKITTNANLYFDPKANKLYTTTQEFKDDGSSISRVYMLDFPPINKSNLFVYEDKSDNRFIYIYFVAIAFFVIAISLFIFKKKNKKSNDNEANITVDDESNISIDPNAIEQTNEEGITIKNKILLFGDFTVYDKKGSDITYLFSSRLIYTFLIFIEFHEKGVTAQILNERLWPEKDEYSAKNIRNVTINHLRKILSDISGIKLIFEKGLYQLKLEDPCYCDYFDLDYITSSSKSFIDKKNILENIKRGIFLNNVESSTTNNFKVKTNERIISILELDIEELFSKKNYIDCILFSNILLNFSPGNLVVIKLKTVSLIKLKKNSEAKRFFTINETLYKNLKQNIPFSFEELTNLQEP